MKRVNEVFYLPIKTPTWSGTDLLDVDGVRVAEFNNREQAEAAVRAINNVDALADALENLIEVMQHDHWVSFKGSNPEAAELPTCRQLFDLSYEGVSLKSKTDDAMKALAAYRGAK